MSTSDSIPDNTEKSSSEIETNAEILASDLDKVHLTSADDATDLVTSSVNSEAETRPRRPLIVYSRWDLLHLSKSPLVKTPDGMPSFKNWFGETNEQFLISVKKENETSNGNANGRDKRYRRDGDDGEASSRPQFRSALSQPSQMGNFKHQPLRGGDGERASSDIRTMADKFDRDRGRDRLGLPTHSTLLRNRDRESAPHLASGRESGKKRGGESSEDWRRGAEPLRGSRDDHHSRRDREDRERPRSKVRDSSRQRDSPPATRRDREDRERRDRERFADTEDDPRRWRDDGKREERLSNRRDKDRLDKDKDRERSRDVDADRDGWTATDDRDTRGLKRNHRERRYASGAADESRDKEDRREREKEKEPAWMDAYVPPTSSSGGILGGKGADGELDSIQAWKKDMKEKEMKAKGVGNEETSPTEASEQKAVTKNATVQDQPLDEIQMFKLMMKQEEQKNVVKSDAEENIVPPKPPRQLTENNVPGFLRVRGDRAITETQPIGPALPDLPPIQSSQDSFLPSKSITSLSDMSISLSGDSLLPGKLLGKATPDIGSNGQSHTPTVAGPVPSQSGSLQSIVGPRADSTGPKLVQTKPAIASSPIEHPVREGPSPSVQFDPPRQSRFLTFGAQNSKASTSTGVPNLPAPVANPRGPPPLDQLWQNNRPTTSPAFNQQTGRQSVLDRMNGPHGQMMNSHDNFGIEPVHRNAAIPHENIVLEKLRMSVPLEDGRDSVGFSPMDSSRSTSLSDRNSGVGFLQMSDTHHQLTDLRGRNGTPPTAGGFGMTSPISPFEGQTGVASSYSSGKGSRMAKHFGSRDSHSIGRSQGQALISPASASRPDPQGFNVAHGGSGLGGDTKNITDLLTMLNNSAQQQRQHNLPSNAGFNQGLSNALNPPQPQGLQQLGGLGSLGRHDSLESEGFVADNLVPGLRPRNRDIPVGGPYGNQFDDSPHFNVNMNVNGPRMGPQQRMLEQQLLEQRLEQQRMLEQRGAIDPRTLEQLSLLSRHPGQLPGQGPTSARVPSFQQTQSLRGAPSPSNNFNPLQQGGPQQRLPPGLANLGGRPPHEPGPFLGGGGGNGLGIGAGAGFGLQGSQGLHAGLQQTIGGSGLPPQQNFGGGLPFQGAGPGNGVGMMNAQLRGPPPGALGMGAGGGLNGMEFRGGPTPSGPPANHLLGLGGPAINPTGAGMRNTPNYGNQQLHGAGLPPAMGLRQQQQQQQQLPPPHIMQQMLGPQIQQHGMAGSQPNQNDLMALLMGGNVRD